MKKPVDSIGLIFDSTGAVVLERAGNIAVPIYYDLGYQRGAAVFETILVRDGIPFMPEAHIERLIQSCEVMRIPIVFTVKDALPWLQVITKKNCTLFPLSTLRIIVSAATTDGLRPAPYSRLVMFQYPLNEYPRELYEKGIALGLMDYERPFLEAKTVHAGYEQARIWLSEPEHKEHFDVLFCKFNLGRGRREITECSRSNFFCVSKRGDIRTSPNALPGVTRSIVTSLFPDLPCGLPSGNFCIDNCILSLSELSSMRACFITSTTVGIMPVRKVGHQEFPVDDVVLRELMKAYRKYQDTYFAART